MEDFESDGGNEGNGGVGGICGRCHQVAGFQFRHFGFVVLVVTNAGAHFVFRER